MLANSLKIKNNSLSDETTTISSLCSYFSKEIEESQLLVSGNFSRKNVETTGKFSDSVWALHRPNTSTYGYIEFKKLEELLFINVSKEQIDLIKAWISKLFLDRKVELNNDHNVIATDISTTPEPITLYNRFVEFLEVSGNFSKEFLELDKGDKLTYYFAELSLKLNNTNLNRAKKFILSYLRFSFVQHHISDEIYSYNIYPEYIKRLEDLLDDTYGSTESNGDDDEDSVHLPCSTDVLKLNYYINKFFNDETIDEDVKLYYYPIYIWWKVTLVIPMRISEITGKTPRNCVHPENDCYYLKIGRVKERFTKKNALPLVTDFKITKEIYDLIDFYIKKTDEYGNSRTLFSYNAYTHLRYIIGNKFPKLFPIPIYRDDNGRFTSNVSNTDIKESLNETVTDKDSPEFSINYKTAKYDTGLFGRTTFDNLLNSFYNKIIETYYEDTSINEKLRGNQTRHLAFSYLLFQRIPRVEVAIIGGHSDTKTIDSYTYDNDVYIDSQVKININKKIYKDTPSEETLYDKVLSMPKECPIPIENSVETEFEGITLGCCIASVDTACESFTCYKCSHWYCEPTIENFRTLFNVVKKELDKENSALYSNINFMSKLIDNGAILSANSNELSYDKDYYKQMQELGNNIRSNADKIIEAKTKLLESMLEKGKEYTELEIIDKLALLNQTFNKNTVFME